MILGKEAPPPGQDPKDLTLIVGPRRSGKTSTLIFMYRKFMVENLGATVSFVHVSKVMIRKESWPGAIHLCWEDLMNPCTGLWVRSGISGAFFMDEYPIDAPLFSNYSPLENVIRNSNKIVMTMDSSKYSNTAAYKNELLLCGAPWKVVHLPNEWRLDL